MTEPATRALHAGGDLEAAGELVEPIVASTTYRAQAPGQTGPFTYSRSGNPTVAALEDRLVGLTGGIAAVAYGSGMAAIDATLRAAVEPGDTVLVSEVVYGGTERLLDGCEERWGVQVDRFDPARPSQLDGRLDEAGLVLVETPANPTLDVADVPGIAERTREAGVPFAVDNTFLTPVGQPALDLGADIAIHSTTKYIEGHGTAVGGAVAVRSDLDLVHGLRKVRKTAGTIADPFGAWLTLRGIETLPLRLERVSQTAQTLAERLESHPAIQRGRYPGLDSHPEHALAREQHTHHGGLLAFEPVGGRPAAEAVVEALDVVTLAEHLGTSRTLVTHPATMTHDDVPPERRRELGVTEGLLRLSVGLEAPGDLVEDLSQALDAAREVAPRA